MSSLYSETYNDTLAVFSIEVKPVDIPTEFLEKRITPVLLEIGDLPMEVIEHVTTETPDETTVEISRVRRVVTTTEVTVEEIPSVEITEFVFDDSSPIPSEVIVEKPLEAVHESRQPKTVTDPKAKKPTTPWEAPEDLEIVFEKMHEPQKPTTEMVKPEESVTDEIEVLPTHATSTAQLALYETPKPTVTMTFNLPVGMEEEGTKAVLHEE